MVRGHTAQAHSCVGSIVNALRSSALLVTQSAGGDAQPRECGSVPQEAQHKTPHTRSRHWNLMQQLTGFVEVTQDALPACSVHYPRVLKGFLSRVQRASRISGPQSSPSSDKTAWSSSIRPSAVGRKGHTTHRITRGMTPTLCACRAHAMSARHLHGGSCLHPNLNCT